METKIDDLLKELLITMGAKIPPLAVALEKETDRGCALMAASFLEHELKDLLDSKLIGSSNHKKVLFDFSGPLGSFSSRAKLCYSLGLLPLRALQDIDTIRGIRNKFGHNFEDINFETPEVLREINKLKMQYLPVTEDSIRFKFIGAVLAAYSTIVTSKAKIQAFEAPKNIWVPDENIDVTKGVVYEIMKALETELYGTDEELLFKNQ